MKRIFCIIAAVILIPLLSSCATYVRPVPPPLQNEIVSASPYPGAVWVGGYWVWMHGGYVWIPGSWRSAPPPMQVEVIGVAPYSGAEWVPGHWAWRYRYGRYVWIRGHYRRSY